MSPQQRRALALQAALADYLANHGVSLYDSERKTLEDALGVAQKASRP